MTNVRGLSWLQCMRCNAKTALYGTTEFLCECGGLYDVVHDYEKVILDRGFSGPTDLKRRFDERMCYHTLKQEVHSGVWRFQELVMPSVEKKNIVSLGEGILPFWKAGPALREWVGGRLEISIIPEGIGPTGSFKDFGMSPMVSVAKQSGVKAIGCASTGDTSAAAAAYAARAGIKCVVILPQEGEVTDVQLSQPLAHGAKIITVPGNFDAAMVVIRKLAAEGHLLLANSINPARIEGHQATAFLIAQHFGWGDFLPQHIVLPVGNGSNTSSVGKGMRLLRDYKFINEMPRILAVQSEAANPLARAWEDVQQDGFADPERWKSAYVPQLTLGETTATAARIGQPVSWEKVVREITASRGHVLTAAEPDLNEAVMVAGRDGFSVCPQTGTALAGLRQAVARGFVKETSRVVVVSTAHGLKFPNVPTQYGRDRIIRMPTNDFDAIAREVEAA